MRAHEERAELSAEEVKAIEAALPHLAPALDSLSESDRETVLLRFYGNASHQDVATTLGISEETAKKRGNRALGKLRRFFVGRGVALSAGAVASVLAVSAAQAAPSGLAAAAGEAALTGVGGTLGSAGTMMLAKGVLKMMFMAKMQAVAVVTIAVVAAGAVAVTAVQTQKNIEATYTNVIPRQDDIPISMKGTNGELYVAVSKQYLDKADPFLMGMWSFEVGMSYFWCRAMRLTQEENDKIIALLWEHWKDRDTLEKQFVMKEEGQQVITELPNTKAVQAFLDSTRT